MTVGLQEAESSFTQILLQKTHIVTVGFITGVFFSKLTKLLKKNILPFQGSSAAAPSPGNSLIPCVFPSISL